MGPAILPQLMAELPACDELFSVPWGHIRTIIDKCRGSREKAEFYIRKTVENGWSRAVLLNYLDSGLYERQGKAVNNFSSALAAPQGDLADGKSHEGGGGLHGELVDADVYPGADGEGVLPLPGEVVKLPPGGFYFGIGAHDGEFVEGA